MIPSGINIVTGRSWYTKLTISLDAYDVYKPHLFLSHDFQGQKEVPAERNGPTSA